MNDFKILSNEEYNSHLPLDVVAFHYASPGACGYPGHIRVITRDGRKVRVDYTDTPREIVSRICPPLESIAQASTNNLPMPIGWLRLNMGLGNALFLTSELRREISVAGLAPPEIYRRWDQMIIEALSNIESGVRLETSIDKERVTPAHIETLKDNEIFVFGSNIFGFHDGGASEQAVLLFGAVYGQKEGLQGQSYAIPTDGLPYGLVKSHVFEFIEFAKAHPEKRFLVTRIGCGTAGYDASQIAPLFERAIYVSNIVLPSDFWGFLM